MTAMSPLRRRMIEDMTIRNLSRSTQQSYIYAVAKFSRHFKRSPESSSMARLKASSISATELQIEMAKLAQHGRVLVLLDACRSAAMIGGASNTLPAADMLRSMLSAGNVTVLTSSSADKLSCEDEKWQHGAFSKVLLDALSGSADDIDTDHNGVISMSELTAYVEEHLKQLTDGDQQLALEQRFQGDLFVAGL